MAQDSTLPERAVATLDTARDYFNRSTRGLTEAQSTLTPAPGMMSAAQQVAHAAQTIDWFMEGAFRPEGFDLDFEGHAKVVAGYTSLAAARAWFDKAMDSARALVASTTEEELMAPIAPGPIMGGQPRMAIFSGITDHTAHHRGALTVYARTAGIVPPMPYMDA